MALVVKSALHDWAGKKGMRLSGTVYDALDKHIAEMMGAAAARAKANGRQTIMAQDV